MTEICANHRFFPVGQGLFAAGSVEFWPPQPKPHRNINIPGQTKPAPIGPYRWVYDCGSSSGKHLVTNAIADLKRTCKRKKIDLLTLSHFHDDHINGVVELLDKIGAKTIMLPWAPLWRRLLIGFEQGLRASDPEMLFYVDPVQYFAQEAGDGFGQVLFVMPSDGEGPPFLTDPPGLPEPPEPPEDRDDPEKPSDLGDPVLHGDLEGSYGDLDRRVRMLRPGRTIPVNGVWEFVPYNDPKTEPDDPFGFATKVESYRGLLLTGKIHERQAALKDLRARYEATFGYGAAMNNVSLMLYGGAVGSWKGQSTCNYFYNGLPQRHRYLKAHETRGAILLTGDGNLKDAAKLDSLKEHLDVRRVMQISVFQVPHHGARANWHDGLAALIAPKASVFSSEPRQSYGHPHAEVLRDFWPFNPVQVDQKTGFSTHVFLKR
jgi:glyoxylase-like metal-dependent hydrolase (beta-lactamase superfamily II)